MIDDRKTEEEEQNDYNLDALSEILQSETEVAPVINTITSISGDDREISVMRTEDSKCMGKGGELNQKNCITYQTLETKIIFF